MQIFDNMECINCDNYYDEDIEDECPYCGVSKYAVRCENCGDIIDIDSECCCGRSLDDLEENEDCDYMKRMKLIMGTTYVKTAPTGRPIPKAMPME